MIGALGPVRRFRYHYEMKTNHLPISFFVLEILGVFCLVPGLMGFAGLPNGMPQVLADSNGALALVVTAAGLMVSGLFPFYITRQMAREAS